MPAHDCGLSTSPVDLNHRDSHHPSGSPLAPSEKLHWLRGTLPCIDSPNTLSSSKGQFLRTRQLSDVRRLAAKSAKIPIRKPVERLSFDISGTPIKTTQINSSKNTN